ncbi:MAG: aminotransferase class V-fold PLP-dependent enzyme [Anaerolineae bacterium]
MDQRMPNLIYLDNAATSWPKPAGVAQAVADFITAVGANPGRSAHRLSVAAAELVYDTRALLAELFGAEDPLRVVFCKNVTEALNTILRGLLQPGDHVVTGSMEHNSVMRPLRALERQGVELTIVPASPAGLFPPRQFEQALRPNTRLIVLNHASNVAGTLAPVREIGLIAREHGIWLVVDAAQTAGVYPIHMPADHIDILCFTGHKGLLGPQGTGGFILGTRVPDDAIEPLSRGGTGSRSEEEHQPDFLPDRFESGTLNAAGIAGLKAGLEFLRQEGIGAVRAHEMALTRRLLAGLRAIPGVRIYGPDDPELQVAVVSFTIAGMSPSEAALALDEEFGVMCRVGLHCAPAAHRTIGTFPQGTIRFSSGYFNTPAEIDQALEAVEVLAQRARASMYHVVNRERSIYDGGENG